MKVANPYLLELGLAPDCRRSIFIYPVVCHRQNLDNPYMCYEFRNPPPPSSSLANWQLIQAAQTIWPECDLHAAVSKPVTS